MIVLTAVVICVMWYNSPSFDAADAVEVIAVSPQKKNIYDSVIARGKIEEGNAKQVIIPPSLIEKAYFTVGDRVEKGELLFDVKTQSESTANAAAYQAISNMGSEELQALVNEYGFTAEELLPQKAISTQLKAEKIYSPISGVITAMNAREGSSFYGYTPAAVVSDFGSLFVRLQVPEMYVERIKKGQSAEIKGEAFSKKYSGKVYQIYPKAKEKSSLTGGGETVIDTLITIDNADAKLRPGYSVETKIYTSHKQNAITLPYECIVQDEDNRELVFLIKDGRVYRKEIATGLELESETEITRGLTVTDIVALNPSLEWKDGTLVKEAEDK